LGSHRGFETKKSRMTLNNTPCRKSALNEKNMIQKEETFIRYWPISIKIFEGQNPIDLDLQKTSQTLLDKATNLLKSLKRIWATSPDVIPTSTKD